MKRFTLLFFISSLVAFADVTTDYRVAILDEPSMPGRGHGSPAESFQELITSLPGFSASLLNGEELADPAVFSDEHFDLLIIPTAAGFPAMAVPGLIAF